MVEPLFEKAGDTVNPTRMTVGPWSAEAQHGGAAAALLTGEFERSIHDSGMILVRVSVEFLRPVPVDRMRLSVRVVRPGKRIQILEGSLFRDESEIVCARATAIRLAEIDVPFDIPIDTAPAHPDALPKASLFENPGAFAEEAFDIRAVEGDFHQPGPGKAWFRLRVPVVNDLVPTAAETACAVADFGNGVSNWDPSLSWLFTNTDLTVHLARPPAGEWVMLDAETALHCSGTGLAESKLFDVNGRFGRGAQSLFVEPRSDR